jgi:hypothetical protein
MAKHISFHTTLFKSDGKKELRNEEIEKKKQQEKKKKLVEMLKKNAQRDK